MWIFLFEIKVIDDSFCFIMHRLILLYKAQAVLSERPQTLMNLVSLSVLNKDRQGFYDHMTQYFITKLPHKSGEHYIKEIPDLLWLGKWLQLIYYYSYDYIGP